MQSAQHLLKTPGFCQPRDAHPSAAAGVQDGEECDGRLCPVH